LPVVASNGPPQMTTTSRSTPCRSTICLYSKAVCRRVRTPVIENACVIRRLSPCGHFGHDQPEVADHCAA
jgi:hypothetical protein